MSGVIASAIRAIILFALSGFGVFYCDLAFDCLMFKRTRYECPMLYFLGVVVMSTTLLWGIYRALTWMRDRYASSQRSSAERRSLMMDDEVEQGSDSDREEDSSAPSYYQRGYQAMTTQVTTTPVTFEGRVRARTMSSSPAPLSQRATPSPLPRRVALPDTSRRAISLGHNDLYPASSVALNSDHDEAPPSYTP